MGGPYAPATAALGGTPSKSLDDPITSVFLVLFILGAATHMTIFQINRRRGKKFIMSAMTFGFCMARIVACTMRLVWSTHLTNIPIAIAASIFVAAGVLILFIVNTIFAQRILRAQHPHFGWKKSISVVFKVLYASIIGGLICIITVTVQSFYTLNPNIRQSDVDVQHVVGIFFAVIAFLPIPLLSLRVILPKKSPTEKFGEGRFSTKIVVLLFTSFILCLGAAFRAGIGFYPRPRNDPAWYHSKACFYIFNFTIEITVVFLYAVIRVDKRFHVPNGSHGPGDYSRDSQKEGYEQEQGLGDRINDEEQLFDSVEQQPEVDVEMQTPEDKSRNRSENTISPPARSPGVGSTEQILS